MKYTEQDVLFDILGAIRKLTTVVIDCTTIVSGKLDKIIECQNKGGNLKDGTVSKH